MDCRTVLVYLSFICIAFLANPETGSGQPYLFYIQDGWSSAHFSTFIEKKEVKGYAALYNSFMLGDYTSYRLDILDNNLKTVRSSNFQIAPGRRIRGICFNGNAVCITLESQQGVLIEHQIYDIDGILISIIPIGQKDMLANWWMRSIPYTGFVGYALNSDNELALKMHKNNGDVVWTINPDRELIIGRNKIFEKLTISDIFENVIVLKGEFQDIKASELPESGRECYKVYNILTGNKINDLVVENSERTNIPSGLSFEGNEFFVFGQYFLSNQSDAGFDGDRSEGFYIHVFDTSGNLQKESYTHWNDYSHLINLGDHQTDTSVWLNDLVKSQGGKYYLCSELYHVSRKAELGNVLIFELDEYLKLRHVRRYKKSPQVKQITLFKPNKYAVGRKIFQSGELGYQYSSTASDRKRFSFVYSTPIKESKSKGFEVGAIGLDFDQSFQQTSFQLDSNADKLYLLPAKNGYVATLEYFPALYTGILNFYKLDM